MQSGYYTPCYKSVIYKLISPMVNLPIVVTRYIGSKLLKQF